MARLEFFFDVSSPWTYLAFHRIEEFAAKTGVELVRKPFLIGGVFNKVSIVACAHVQNGRWASVKHYFIRAPHDSTIWSQLCCLWLVTEIVGKSQRRMLILGYPSHRLTSSQVHNQPFRSRSNFKTRAFCACYNGSVQYQPTGSQTTAC